MFIIIFYALFLGYYYQVCAGSNEFSCSGRVAGYYADLASDCEQYHVCTGGKRQYTYFCPNTTRFLQKMMICEHAHLVDCSLSENYFSANLLLGQRVPFIPQPSTEFHDRVNNAKNNQFGTTQLKPSNSFKSTIPSSTLRSYDNRPYTASTKHDFHFATPKSTISTEPSTTLVTSTNGKSPLLVNFEFGVNQPKLPNLLKSTITSFPSTLGSNVNESYTTTTKYDLTFSTLKEIDTPEPSRLLETSTPRIIPVLENEAIKPLPGPPITLYELFEKLQRGSYESNSVQKSSEEESFDKGRGMKLDWTLPDVRAMFFIPDNERDNVVPNIKRYSIVIPESKMIFKSKEIKNKNNVCPSKCDPVFLNFETCSPCVMIK